MTASSNASEADSASSIFDLIRIRADRSPDTAALAAPGRRPLSYASLARQVTEVGRRLAEAGIRRGERVAVVLPNGPEMATTFLGVAAVATCAPLNPAYGADEFTFYLEDLRARGLVVREGDDTAAIGVARARGMEVLTIRVDDGAGAGQFEFAGDGPRGRTDTIQAAGPEDVALVLHTSGTTSRPKAVPLTHANLLASARHVHRSLELEPTDRCLNVMPLFHIHGLVASLLASLDAGASVACCPAFDPVKFFDWLARCRPSWYTAVPTMHQAILGQAGAHQEAISACPLRLIRSSSAALPPSVMRELEGVFGAPVLEAYGMTEAAHQMTSNPLPPGSRKPGSVGLPAGPEVAIMGEGGGLLPAGEAGEIVIRGPNVTPGYLEDADANRVAFCNGWFRTGDEGQFDPDGYLTITGRLKEMINRGGEKLAPREIDEALLAHPSVAQAVTFALPHRSLGEEVAAGVVLRPGRSATEAELRSFAAGRLAVFKVPARVLILDEIPKGPTGKVQRIGLAGRLADLLLPDYVAPVEPDEVQLATFWSEVLGPGRVGIDDNFFQSGGDSIEATRLAARVRKAFDVDMPLAEIFASPTIRGLSRAIARLLAAGPARSATTITRLARPRAAPGPGGGAAVSAPPPSKPRVEGGAGGTAPEVVEGRATDAGGTPADGRRQAVRFSLFFFSADGASDLADKYGLMLDAARFADEHGFVGVWTPERHFNPFGGLYPNPAVTGAALAAITRRVQIRAGSVVLPLQDPVRVAEEWSVVDNLSRGRVGLSFASGWHADDFALAPGAYADRRRIMLERIDLFRRLWRGQAVRRVNGVGAEVELRIYPRPLQTEPPIWLACHSDATFLRAGEIGANVLTVAWRRELPDIARQVALYRDARARSGFDPRSGVATLMLHTFLARSEAEAQRLAGAATHDYVASNIELRESQARTLDGTPDLVPRDRDFLASGASSRLFRDRGLIGTVEHGLEVVEAIRGLDVDEIACLIDFGIEPEHVMSGLERLVELDGRLRDPAPSRSAVVAV